jgi:hypothetical protein
VRYKVRKVVGRNHRDRPAFNRNGRVVLHFRPLYISRPWHSRGK